MIARMINDVKYVMSLIRDAQRGSVEAGNEVERIEFASLYGSRTVKAARQNIKREKPKND